MKSGLHSADIHDDRFSTSNEMPARFDPFWGSMPRFFGVAASSSKIWKMSFLQGGWLMGSEYISLQVSSLPPHCLTV